MLAALVWIPLLGALLLWFLPRPVAAWLAWGANAAQAALLGILWLISSEKAGTPWPFWAEESSHWLSLPLGEAQLNLSLSLALDALNMPLLWLSVFVFGIALWLTDDSNTKHKQLYYSLLLLLNACLMGSLLSLNFLIFYIFFELMLVPLYFLIGLWGGEKRVYATVKLFVYTLLGSFLLLTGAILLAKANQNWSFEWTDWLIVTKKLFVQVQKDRQYAFWLILLGFGIKLPLVPLHTWLPSAHVEASTPVSVLLAALVLKIGGYGLFRFWALVFPAEVAYFQEYLALLGLLTVLYASLAALGQAHLKTLIAYASVGHLGFVLIGLASQNTVGMSGAYYQMLGHGVVSALLFALAGSLQKRGGSWLIADYSGLWAQTPWWAACFAVGMLSAMSLPLSPGFVAEVLVLLGTFKALGPVYGLMTAVVMLFAVSYSLWALKRLFFGKAWQNPDLGTKLADMPMGERVLCGVLVLATLFLGILPFEILKMLDKIF